MPGPELVSEGFWEYRAPPVQMGCFKCGNDIFRIEKMEDQEPLADPEYLRIRCAVCGERIGHLTMANITWGDVGEVTKND